MKHLVKLNLTHLMATGALFTLLSAVILVLALVMGIDVSGTEIAGLMPGGAGG